MEMSNQNQKNNKAVITFVLGILSLLTPFIGFILGIIGLVYGSKSTFEIRSTGQTGMSLVTAGRVCCVIGICVQILFAIFAILGFAAYWSVDSISN